ncbi:hypothetical protein KDA_10040 [Dictyobacter alpinus]|uniref:Uncharacterized protein n=1 Tax=Dictyobacter alpinus TaxID=2014873 RepID=A0A402B2D3_9CHLR|nr:hypothetical protein KDA_10040 [Dictyobacter alpinus]
MIVHNKSIHKSIATKNLYRTLTAKNYVLIFIASSLEGNNAMSWKAKYSWFTLILIVLTAFLCLEVALLFATDYTAIVTGHPAYEVSLIVVGAVSLLTFFGLLLRPNRSRVLPSSRATQQPKKLPGI